MISRRTVRVALGAIIAQNKVLLVRRRDPNIPEYHEYWELPGGKIEPEESHQETAEREVLEETGMAVQGEASAPFTYEALLDLKSPPLQVSVWCWLCRLTSTFTADPISPEGLECEWVDVSEVHKRELIPGSREFLTWALYANGTPSALRETMYELKMESIERERNRLREYDISLAYDPRHSTAPFIVTARASRILGQKAKPIVKSYDDLTHALTEVRKRVSMRQKSGYRIVGMPQQHPLRSWMNARGMELESPAYPTLPLE